MNISQEVKAFVIQNADENLAEFSKKLIFTKYKIYGIKTAQLEAFAKELAKKDVNLYELPLDSHEEILIAGMTLSYSKMPEHEKIVFFNKLINHIDNWGTCDMIVCRLKKCESEIDYFKNLLTRAEPIQKRVGIIFLMRFALKADCENTVSLVLGVQDENYYVKMAQAWLIAEAALVEFDFVYETIKNLTDREIKLKAIQKLVDSFRITVEQKEKLKKLR